MTMSDEALAQNRRTIAAYESYAERYDAIVSQIANRFDQGWLKRLVGVIGEGSHVLEVGSGPGREADFLETLGVTVRRTDATQKFLDIQAVRGNKGELLNIITDDLGGPYDAVVALCVLIHVPRVETAAVLAKIAANLRPGGAFLVSMRSGDGDTDDGRYHTVYWRRDAFAARLEAAGLTLLTDQFYNDVDGDEWNIFLVMKPA